MDSFTFNKIAGAVLGTCLFGMGLGIIAQGIYEPSAPTKPGYPLPMPKEETGGGKGPVTIPLPVLLAKADAKKGENSAKVCGACHNFKEGEGAKVGPDLYGVVDRAKASVQGFDYSSALKAKGGKWTFQDLNEWLTSPSKYASGTKMAYPGEEDAQKRADIIAYLRSLAKEPVPLPKPTPEEEKQAQGGGEAKTAEGGKAGGDDLVKLIADTPPQKGESAAKVCGACHNFKEGEGNKVGPDLYGVVDREKASVQGFDYSSGLKSKGGKWTYQDLNEWLTSPSKYAPGTKMAYPGETDEKKRAAIISYLRSLAKTPAPLPAAGEGGGEKKADAGGAAKPAEAGAPAAGGGDGGGDAFAKLVAEAKPEKGKSASQVCGACHNFKEGEGNKVGPDLYGVVDREKASVQGFNYSPALKGKGGKWTYDDLNKWLTNPQAYAPGTIMGFAGEPDEKKRAAIVAYLRSNAKTPEPLPGAGGADEKKPDAGGAAKPAEGGGEKKTDAGGAAKPAEGGGEKKTDAGGAAKPAEGGGEKKAEGGAPAAAGGFVKLVAEAKPEAGQGDAMICGACHNFKEGEGNKVGPDLYGVVDRDKASVQGFNYSPALKGKGGKWTYDDLDKWLTNPQAYAPGTIMGFAGEPDEKKRAAIVAFLRSLAKTPAPLPGGEQKKTEATPSPAEAPRQKADAAPPAPVEQKDMAASLPPPSAEQKAKATASLQPGEVTDAK